MRLSTVRFSQVIKLGLFFAVASSCGSKNKKNHANRQGFSAREGLRMGEKAEAEGGDVDSQRFNKCCLNIQETARKKLFKRQREVKGKVFKRRRKRIQTFFEKGVESFKQVHIMDPSNKQIREVTQ